MDGEHRSIGHFCSRINDTWKEFGFLVHWKSGSKKFPDKIVADLDPRIRVNFANSVFRESPKFKSLGLPTLDATDIRNLYFDPSSRAKSLHGTQRDNFRDARLRYTHDFDRMSETTAYSNHIKNSDLETREVFEQETQNIPQTRQIYLVTTLNENSLTQSTDSSKNKERHKPEMNSDSELSLSYLSWEISSSDSIAKKKKCNRKKNRRKHWKDDSSDPSLSDDYDSSDDSNYRRKQHKNKKRRKKDPITQCATLTSKLLMTAYKSKIIRFKMDKYPPQHRIYFLAFV